MYVEQKGGRFSPTGRWNCSHTGKNPIRPKKVYQKYVLFSMRKSERVTKVQSVFKTDQRADVSAHAFFTAHGAKKQQHT